MSFTLDIRIKVSPDSEVRLSRLLSLVAWLSSLIIFSLGYSLGYPVEGLAIAGLAAQVALVLEYKTCRLVSPRL